MALVLFESDLVWWFFIEGHLSSRFRKWAVARCCKHVFLAFADPVFGHVRVPKCDSCCDDGTGWGGWYQAGWSGVPASWGFEVVPCNTVLGSSQLQTASNCSCSYCSNCFKLLQSASNCFKMLQRMFRRAPFCEARDTLLQAARDGRLASAFKEMRKASVLQLCFMWVAGVTKTIW